MADEETDLSEEELDIAFHPVEYDYGMKGISRIDHKLTHGWYVRGYRNGRTYSRMFSDQKYGGEAAALTLAKHHRDKLFDYIHKMKKTIGRYSRKGFVSTKHLPIHE